MATRAADDLNEFFDFDQLEHDHGSQAPNLPHQQHVDPFDPSEVAMPMDWTTHDLASVSNAYANSMQITFENVDMNHHAQWPLLDVPNDLLANKAVDLYPVSCPISEVTNTVNLTEDQSPPSTIAPSISLISHEHQEPIGNQDSTCPPNIINMEPGLPLLSPKIPSPSPTLVAPRVDETAVAHRTRPSTLLRQTSTASRKPASAKRKGPQSRIPLESKQILEDEFAVNPYPCSWEMDIIAHQANLEVKKVRNWYNNARARKKSDGSEGNQYARKFAPDEIGRSLSKLSRDSLEALDQEAEADVLPPQPLAVYLAQSYQEEGIEFPSLQAAIENRSLSTSDSYDDNWSQSPRGRTGSVITSIASSEGTAPTTYTVSSSGSRSNISSFGRDRRRGRRRMAWKESPYNNRPKFNGVNSAGEPQKDLPFFCTFCPRAFKTKYEWIRHEDSVHALRTTWICCDTKNTPLESCPFCGQEHPDQAHMAGHKYQQCRNKPESQRTFYRRDHFVQHLHHVHFANAKHPSVRSGCQARLMDTAGNHFGCKDLAMSWRRFGAPMKRDDPMLHCGMCGKKSKDWSERCEHVAEHLIARDLDRSAWWSERKENHLENLYSASPFESFRCRYCLKIFTDISEMNDHTHCKVWSCRFLKSFDDVTADNAGPPLCPDFPSAKAHHCHLCGAGYRTPHSEHAQSYHRYRSCNQEFYTSEEAFLQHLHNFHGASQPTLLQGSSVIEQNFMRNKGASFEPVEFNESWQPCLMELDTDPVGPFTMDKLSSTPMNIERKDHSSAKKVVSARKKGRDDSSMSSGSTKTQRQRSDTTASKAELGGPRFFRLSTYVPFLSARIFYVGNSKPAGLPRDNQAVLEEMPKPHIASLVMSAGLVGMAAVRLAIRPQRDDGIVELTMDEAD